MQRFAVLGIVFVGACFFDADYGGGSYRCSDGRCPSGLVCDTDANRCVSQLDGGSDGPTDAIDAPSDVPIDTPQAALTCIDPGVIAAAGGTVTGTTVGRTSMISSTCGGSVMNGPDAVYRISAGAGDQYLISITGVKAYVILPCSISPSTPVCAGNNPAAPGSPILVTTAVAGQHYIVVDHESATTSAAYTLTVTKQ